MRWLRVLGILLGIYVALALGREIYVGYVQPQREHTIVLRTFPADGEVNETVLGLLVEENGQLWVKSGHWFRGWYHEVLRNPEVDLVRDGVARPYLAVPASDEESVERVERLMGKGKGVGFWIGRVILLWAPIKPVRLDPRPPEEGAP